MFRFDIARGKAWGAMGMGSSSRALAKRDKDYPNFFVALAATAEGKLVCCLGSLFCMQNEN